MSLRLIRTTIEVTVLTLGWLLSGTVGLGTVVYAVSIGPLTHRSIPALRLRTRPPPVGDEHQKRSTDPAAPGDQVGRHCRRDLGRSHKLTLSAAAPGPAPVEGRDIAR